MTDQTITLTDGRILCYAVYGPETGQALWYFHGTPSSRLEPLLLDAYSINLNHLLERYNLKLIAIDRPGMGFSSYNKEENFLSFTKDVEQLRMFLKIDRCPVLCWSGGGPFALAMANQYPEQISGVYIFCGLSRRLDDEVLKEMGTNKIYFNTARYAPWILDSVMSLIRKSKINYLPPQKLTGLPDVDYQLLNDPKHLRRLTDYTLKEACRNGARGPVHESRMYFNHYGFNLSDIMQPVHYWWGTEDLSVIRLHAEAVEKQVPHSTMHYYQGEGHFSLFLKYFEEALATIRQ
ncbi:MAG TPA: alpha/beta hydrolase [Flavisolibacter sp.]|nr:alpha/beta hydrolase [Flavisolibacter sp.]